MTLDARGEVTWRDPGPISREDMERTAELLRSVMGDKPRCSLEVIDHWYNRSPEGHALQLNEDSDDGRRLVHLAAIPARLEDQRGPVIIGQIVDASSAPEVQRSGRYAKLLLKSAGEVGTRGGVGIFGVSNEAGTPAALSIPGAMLAGALPVRVCVPSTPASSSTWVVDDAWLKSSGPEDLMAEVDLAPRGPGLIPTSTPAMLRWRLGLPGGAYSIHRTAGVVAVATEVRIGVLSLPIILRAFRTKGSSAPLARGSEAVWSVAKHYKRPLVIHAGLNDRVRFRGVLLPRKRLPSPLNVLFCASSPDFDPDRFHLRWFEFLDFDTY